MHSDFADIYLQVRAKENRIYSEKEVSLLPSIAASHPHHKEWQLRQQSAQQLYDWLHHKKKPLKILEVGCGNGWLSAFLANNPNATVTGIDINKTELEQAKRVFKIYHNLQFLDSGLDSLKEKFDVIVYAASLQYFPSFTKNIDRALSVLENGGEIHIINIHFYSESWFWIFAIRESRL